MTDLIPVDAPSLAKLIYTTFTPDLLTSLTRRVGRDEAVRLWWEAADLLERHYPIPRTARVEAPRPYDVVVTANGVDHAPVPGEPVAVCGLEFPALYCINPPHGVPCGDCFGETS